jgi:hypothetical protein
MRKAPVVIAAALFALGAAAGAGAQQQGPQHGSMMRPGMMMGMDPDDWGVVPMMMRMHEMMMGQGSMPMMGMGQHVEGRLAFLKAELKITPAQEPLWNTFAETMRANAPKIAGTMPCCAGAQGGGMQGGGAMRQGGMMAQGAVPSLPERLDWQERSLAARLDALRAMRGALTPLYAAFGDEQKQMADRLIRGPMGLGMMM